MATITSVANGFWNNSATWDAGVPTGGDSVVIAHHVSLNVNSTNIASVTVTGNLEFVTAGYLGTDPGYVVLQGGTLTGCNATNYSDPVAGVTVNTTASTENTLVNCVGLNIDSNYNGDITIDSDSNTSVVWTVGGSGAKLFTGGTISVLGEAAASVNVSCQGVTFNSDITLSNTIQVTFTDCVFSGDLTLSNFSYLNLYQNVFASGGILDITGQAGSYISGQTNTFNCTININSVDLWTEDSSRFNGNFNPTNMQIIGIAYFHGDVTSGGGVTFGSDDNFDQFYFYGNLALGLYDSITNADYYFARAVTNTGEIYSSRTANVHLLTRAATVEFGSSQLIVDYVGPAGSIGNFTMKI